MTDYTGLDMKLDINQDSVNLRVTPRQAEMILAALISKELELFSQWMDELDKYQADSLKLVEKRYESLRTELAGQIEEQS